MKKLFLLLSLVLSTSAFAGSVEWSDLEMEGLYSLKQDVVFENGISFKAGEQFHMVDLIAGEIPVIYFEMYHAGCTDYAATADLILVNIPQPDRKDVVVGAQLYEGCNLGFYIEPRDYYSQSLFNN